MDARERILAVLAGEEPDRVPVLGCDTLGVGSPGGWVRRLTERGLGIVRRLCPYRPHFSFPSAPNPLLPDVRCVVEQYLEGGKVKMRHTLQTPVGSVTSTLAVKFAGTSVAYAREDPFVKETRDWRVITHIYRQLAQVIAPNYGELAREEDALGGRGMVFGYLTKTPFPSAWIQLASPERAIVDFAEKPEELLELLDTLTQFHRKAAAIAAASPAHVLNFYDNITDMVSPRFFREFCLPFYAIYAEALKGTGKTLACHMDGRLGHLKQEVAVAPLQLIESMTVPPVGSLSLREARSLWPDKVIFINCPAHLANSEADEVRAFYGQIRAESGNRRYAVEYVEDMPAERVEPHLSAALDAFGY